MNAYNDKNVNLVCWHMTQIPCILGNGKDKHCVEIVDDSVTFVISVSAVGEKKLS